jgi:hypothetical protein
VTIAANVGADALKRAPAGSAGEGKSMALERNGIFTFYRHAGRALEG